MLHGWDNFYLLTGTVGGGLIGLLFVVVTLTSGLDRDRATYAASLFMTPTAVHFAAVLVTSAVFLVPELPVWAVAGLITLTALVGLAHAVIALIGLIWPKGIEIAHWSDRWTYGVIPVVAYVVFAAAAITLWAGVGRALYAIAAMTLILLLVGLRNAWDLITWMAPRRPGQADSTQTDSTQADNK